LAGAAHATTYWVSTTGSDSNPGTEAAPWKTLQHTVGLLSPGDTVRVKAGSYAGFVYGWDGEPGGTAQAPITYLADPGVVITSRNSKTADGINIEGADYIRDQGFTVHATITSGVSNIARACIRSVNNIGAEILNKYDGELRFVGIYKRVQSELASRRKHVLWSSTRARVLCRKLERQHDCAQQRQLQQPLVRIPFQR
jgi:hypothetical protein